MTLRTFTIDDAPIILSWIKDKTAFRKWSADRYSVYPPMPEDMLAQYESGVIFPFTAIDDEGKVVGHIILRYPDSSKTVIRFGFVIVDNNLRGKGYGKQMLRLAIQKAKNEFGAKAFVRKPFSWSSTIVSKKRASQRFGVTTFPQTQRLVA